MTGSTIFKEATARGHEVTAFARNRQKAVDLLNTQNIIEADVFDITREQLLQFDVVIDALNTPRGQGIGYLHIDMAAHLIHLLRETDTPRIFFIVGAASLYAPDGEQFIEKFKREQGHEEWIDTPQSQVDELQFIQNVQNVNWVAVSPSMNYHPGEKTNYTRNDEGQIIFNQDHQSVLSSGNMAAAIVDEIEQPKIKRGRFTIGDAD